MHNSPTAETNKACHPAIRPAAGADCVTVRRIAHAAYALYLPRMDKEPAPMTEDYEARAREETLFVLETEEGIAGFVVLVPEEGAVLLDNVAVAPASQGKGYGRRLVEFTEDRARAAGAEELRLYTNEVMVENLRLYARLGFTETRRAVHNGFHRVFMSKKL